MSGAPPARRTFSASHSLPVSRRGARRGDAAVVAWRVPSAACQALADDSTQVVEIDTLDEVWVNLDAAAPDLLLVRWRERDVDAEGLLERVRARWGRVDLPVIAVVDDATGPAAVEALLGGATAVATPDAPEVLAALVEASLSTRHQGRRLREEAERDHLTGLYSRAYMEHRLLQEWSAAARHGHALTLVVGDLDDYKRVNDQHGHAAGDAVLAAFGRLLRENTRREDVTARFGGDELVLILPRTDADGARQLVERIGRLLAAERFASPVAPPFHVTASFGIAQTHSALESVDDLFAEADRALYLAKRDGKGRAHTYRP